MGYVIAGVGGFVGGALVAAVCCGRYVVGYWPWQGEDAARRAGW